MFVCLATLKRAAFVAPQAVAGSTPGYEPPFWQRTGAVWRQLAGSFSRDGFSFEWHELQPPANLNWANGFHPASVEICLNLQGSGWVVAEGARMDLGPDTAAFLVTNGGHLKGQRLASQRHQFLSVEFSLPFLQHRLTPHAAHLHPLIRRFLAGVSPVGGLSGVTPLTRRHRDLLKSLLHPPVLASAQRLWYETKALEFAAEFFFSASDTEPLCTRAQRLAAERIARAKAILSENLAEPPSREELGRRVACSHFYLSRTFTRETGLTLSQWLRRARLERTAELLCSRKCDVTEAALEVGYSGRILFTDTNVTSSQRIPLKRVLSVFCREPIDTLMHLISMRLWKERVRSAPRTSIIGAPTTINDKKNSTSCNMKSFFKSQCSRQLGLGGLILAFTLNALAGPHEGYRQINLVADQTGMARFADTNLVNPWGILALGGLLIVADNHAGVSTFYNPAGHPAALTIAIPAPDGSPGGAVTDLALNRSARSFIIRSGERQGESTLLFVTEDGTIAGWNHEVHPHQALIAVDNSAAGAIYKSMALAATPQGPRLYAANFGQGVVEIYDGGFHLVKSFTDAGLAGASYAPFGVRVIGGRLFVTYAFKASPADGDETAGPGLGYVDVFDLGGTFVRRFASQGTLNAPWGLALAPRGFGQFGGALLVGNFGDGAINAYQPHTGAFLGQLSDSHGTVIQIEGLWGLALGSEGGSLYFTAGPNDESNGLLGVVRAEGAGNRMKD